MYSYCSFLPPGPSQATLINCSHCGTHFLFPTSVSGDSVVFNSGSLSPLNDWNLCAVLGSQMIGTDVQFHNGLEKSPSRRNRRSDFEKNQDLDSSDLGQEMIIYD